MAEADESDGSFLRLAPILTVVTNIDKDHLDFYDNQDAIDLSFIRFMNSIPFYGMNVVCGDDEGVQRLLPLIKRPYLTYGLNKKNRLRGEIVSAHLRTLFKVFFDGEEWGEVTVAQPGTHNVLNALACIGVAIEAGLEKEDIINGLGNFGGVGRRFERKGERKGVVVVDDYGHHPAEITANLRTAKECYPDRRLVVAFQPHRFSRTQALFGEFCQAFGDADLLLLTEIYPASESPIPGVSGLSLAQGIKQVSETKVQFFPDFESLEKRLKDILKPGDLFMTQGAGSIWTIGENWLEQPEIDTDEPNDTDENED